MASMKRQRQKLHLLLLLWPLRRVLGPKQYLDCGVKFCDLKMVPIVWLYLHEHKEMNILGEDTVKETPNLWIKQLWVSEANHWASLWLQKLRTFHVFLSYGCKRWVMSPKSLLLLTVILSQERWGWLKYPAPPAWPFCSHSQSQPLAKSLSWRHRERLLWHGDSPLEPFLPSRGLDGVCEQALLELMLNLSPLH